MTVVVDQQALLGAAPAGSSAPDTRGAGLLRFIACGSVDDGKSTLIGRLLYDSKSIPDDQLETLDKDSRRFGTQGAALDLALLVDGLAAEREQGITIDVAYRYFATARRAFIVADTPGHEQYTRNMATGASTADLAIILIDARKGILPQTRRHSFIVSMLGVKHVAVAVNKMDLVGYDREVFERIVAVYRTMVAELGFAQIEFFPISALNGDNVVEVSAATPWRRGGSLLQYLESAEIAPATEPDELLFPVQWVNRPDHDFRGYSGWVARGSLRRGDEILALPRGSRSRVERIVAYDGDLESASRGQSVTIVLADELDVSRGDWLVAANSKTAVVRQFGARLLWTSERPFNADGAYYIKIGTCFAPARVTIDHLIDIHSFESEPSSALTMNAIARAVLKLGRPIVAPAYRDSHELGGFILIDRQTNETAALGVIEPDASSRAVIGHSESRTPWRNRAQTALRFLTGRETTRASLARDLANVGAGTLASASLVFVLTRDLALSALFVIADALLRPGVRLGCRLAFAKAAKAREDELNSDGAGI